MNESIHNEQNLGPDKDIIKSCVHSSLPLQAKETSNKPTQTDNSSAKGKKVRRKNESTRLGALLPDDIWLTNHMTCSRMSAKEYNSRCKNHRRKKNYS